MSRRVRHFRPFKMKTQAETAVAILRHKQGAMSRGVVVTRQMDPEKALRIARQLHRTRA